MTEEGRDILRKQLIRDEGSRSYAYQDSRGYWTIGIGHLIDRRGGSLKDKFITAIFEDDLDEKAEQLDKALPFWRSLDEPRQRVVINMAFNLGVDGLLTFHNFCAALERKEFETAAAEILDSEAAKQLPARYLRLSDQMRTGEDIINERRVPRY